MSEKFRLKETAPFVQFSSVNITDEFNPLFDIEAFTDQTLDDYCQKLIDHVFNISHSQIPDFIAHHCNLVKDPLLWLNKFEKLISLNDILFKSCGNDTRLVKIYTSVETRRNRLLDHHLLPNSSKKYINAESEDRYFSFRELERNINSMQNLDEKIYTIMKEKFEYNKASIDFLNTKLPNYSKECDKLLKEVRTLDELEKQIRSHETSKKSLETSETAYANAVEKIKINLNINQLVTIFYDLQREYLVEGKPALEAESHQIVNLICTNFVDKDGNPISPETVRTILLPSKPEKRPKGHKRIDLSELL